MFAQVHLRGPVSVQGGQAIFDGLTLSNGYGKNEQDLRHALCVTHPLLPDSPCYINFQVSDHAGLAEAQQLVAEKKRTYNKTALAKVCACSAKQV